MEDLRTREIRERAVAEYRYFGRLINTLDDVRAQDVKAYAVDWDVYGWQSTVAGYATATDALDSIVRTVDLYYSGITSVDVDGTNFEDVDTARAFITDETDHVYVTIGNGTVVSAHARRMF